jgi:hypothetical protein
MANLDMYLEAERRGILPPDKAGILNEARARGLVPAAPAAPVCRKIEMPAPRMSTGQQVLRMVRPTLKRLAPQAVQRLVCRLALQVLLGALV